MGWRGSYPDRKGGRGVVWEIAFIGMRERDQFAIKAELDGCLLALPKSGAVDTKAWANLPDPFPDWRREAA